MTYATIRWEVKVEVPDSFLHGKQTLNETKTAVHDAYLNVQESNFEIVDVWDEPCRKA